MAKQVALNARFYSHRVTGMQRYAYELAHRFNGRLHQIQPARSLKGMHGHLWEQTYLPLVTKGRLLWSPNNTGPVAISHQVCTIHDLIPIERPEWFSKQFSAWYGWLFPLLAKRVAHIIAISEFTKSRIVDLLNVPESKVTVIPNGFNRFPKAAPDEILTMRRDLGIPAGDYLLCLGSLEPRKNVARLLRAWQRVQPKLSRPMQLVVAGGKASQLVFADAGLADLGRDESVLFTGYVQDHHLSALYSGALGMIYPSLYEGFGLPPLEAMGCGTPVITSSTTSLPEVVGDAAIFVDPEDEESIAIGIARLIEDDCLRESLVQRSLAQTALYSWDQTADRTWQVLQAFS